MVESTGKAKKKLRWSKPNLFSCFRPCTPNPPSVQELLGQPGVSLAVSAVNISCRRRNLTNTPATMYTVLQLFFQGLFVSSFRRVANLYFLLAAVLSFTSLAPFSPVSMIAPLIFVVGIGMLKEAVEDWQRFLQDLNVNSITVNIHVGNGIFVCKIWKESSIGDVVKVRKNEYFPSDLLSSSYDENVCYVETMNLDGEANLKIVRCLEARLGLNVDGEFSRFKAVIRCEDPNPT